MKIDVILNLIAKDPAMALVSGGVILVIVSAIVQQLRIAIFPGFLLIIAGAAWKKYIG